jgi:hypothetical protein
VTSPSDKPTKLTRPPLAEKYPEMVEAPGTPGRVETVVVPRTPTARLQKQPPLAERRPDMGITAVKHPPRSEVVVPRSPKPRAEPT